jgi:vitamin B12 transporter
MDRKSFTSLALLALALSSAAFAQQAATTDVEDTGNFALPTLVVHGQEVANLRPVTTYETPVSNLEFNPRIDFQSRNMAEAQGDVTIRGGIFENTGFRVGSATLIDPQTGHYSAELPIAPEMLSTPDVLVAGDNALYGFNSTIGTISYGWSDIQDGGSATLGGGDHDLNFQRLHHAVTGTFANASDWSWGAEVETSRSESDGTIQYGDHDFDRTTGRVQLVGPNSQTDFFAGYQEKKFGWPGMYTAAPSNHETESLKTRLFSINHQQNYGSDSHWELSSFYRRNSDYYVYQREKPAIYTANHETKSGAVAFAGKHELSETLAINHSAQFTADSIDSTSLEEGDFTSRSYIKISVLPEYCLQLEENEALTLRVGATFDDTNRDSSEVSPIADITWEHSDTNGQSEKVYLSYAQATQVAGYGAIGGGESGRFASNYDLDREISQNLELGGAIKRDEWSFEGAIFYRWDDGLVDWTYSESSSSSRQANPVDIETFGVELIASKRWETIEAIEAIASYTFLDKDEDYGDDAIDASFYALNYANHRVTLGAIWTPCEAVQVRIDNEWRSQEDNALRGSDNEALFTHIGVSVFPPQVDGLELFVAIDNAWNDDYQEVPGTPGRSDQFSAGATFRW